MKRHIKNRGFTLIEVLVTLVLLTIGMLSLVAMQGRGIQFTADSVARNNAIMLANEMMEMIRANPKALEDDLKGYYRLNPETLKHYIFDELEAEGSCSDDEIEVNDVAEQITCWSEKARMLLPGTDGDSADAKAVRNNFYICRSKQPDACDADAGSAVEIQVAWRSVGERCRDGDGAGDDDPFICTLRLRGEL